MKFSAVHLIPSEVESESGRLCRNLNPQFEPAIQKRLSFCRQLSLIVQCSQWSVSAKWLHIDK